MLSGTASQLPRRIGQIIAFDSGCLYLIPLFMVHLFPLNCEIRPKNLDASLYHRCTTQFYTLNRLGVDRQCDRRTDGQTDKITIAMSLEDAR